jgi:hypothetical protein
MYVLLENNIPFQRFVFTQTNLLSSYWGGWLQFHIHISFWNFLKISLVKMWYCSTTRSPTFN